ncbi:MAG: hypothetical protein RLZZ301_1437 [Bacteroidota bacterium]|jgi:tetratricopeptide (TPR) repeat protein
MRYLFISSLMLFYLVACTTNSTSKPDAKLTLNELLEKYPDSIPILIKKGNELIDSLQFQEALTHAAKAFRLDSNRVEARVLYAECLINKPNRSADDILRAYKMYKALVKKEPKNVKALIGMANTLVMLQDYDNAFKFINKALRIDMHYRDAYILKGTIYKYQQNIKLAISSYETAIQQDPSYYMTYLLLGALYEGEGNPLCLEKYKSAYQLQPKNIETIYALAFATENFGNTAAAMRLYRKMTVVDSTFADGYFHIGHLHQFTLNQPDSAMYYYKLAVKANRDHVPSYHNMGMIYEARKDLTNALFSYAKALKVDSTFQLTKDRVAILKKMR